MEKESSLKPETFSAYVRIFAGFEELCKKHEVDPYHAWLAIGTVGGFKLETSSKPNPSSRVLSKQDKEKALKKALKQKAKRLGISPDEVKLTQSEKTDALSAASKEFKAKPDSKKEAVSSPSLKEPKLSAKAKLQDPDLSPEVKPQKKSPKDSSKEESKEKVPKEKAKTGERDTALTRLKAAKRTALRYSPNRFENPMGIQLVAYANHFRRLLNQWESFKSKYDHEDLQDPFTGLPDPFKEDSVLGKAVSELVKLAQIQVNPQSGGIYALTGNGGSYWGTDGPSPNCPQVLKEPLSKEVLSAFSAKN